MLIAQRSQLATGNWQLATGNWQLATGNWQLKIVNHQIFNRQLSLVSRPPNARQADRGLRNGQDQHG